MIYSTSRKLYPGALSDDAAALFRHIYDAGIWFPEWRYVGRGWIDAFAELQRAEYIESTAYYGYRVKGRDCMAAARQHVAQRNKTAFVREAFVSLGIESSNIKSVRPAPTGFAASKLRWCVTLHHAVSLSALQVNWTPGLSGAVWNGNVCWVLVGKEG